MKSVSDMIAVVFGGYSSEKSYEAIEQPQGQFYIESVVDDKEVLEEILQQADMIRNMRI